MDRATASPFVSASYEGSTWLFTFDDGIAVSAEGLWRYKVQGRIVWVSTDHEQKFGLPAPVDLPAEITNSLAGKALQHVTIDDVTGDLTLSLSGADKLEFLTSSSGYESYALSFGNDIYIGGGSGEVSHFLEMTRTTPPPAADTP